jgi:hypothetical protein
VSRASRLRAGNPGKGRDDARIASAATHAPRNAKMPRANARRPPPGGGGSGGTQRVELRMDGREVGEIVAGRIARMGEHVTGPATFYSSLSRAPVDINI